MCRSLVALMWLLAVGIPKQSLSQVSSGLTSGDPCSIQPDRGQPARAAPGNAVATPLIKIASIPYHDGTDNPYVFGDSDHDGRNEVILWYLPDPSYLIHVENLGNNSYQRVYDQSPQEAWVLGDPDQDGLSDILCQYWYSVHVNESADPSSYPNQQVWETHQDYPWEIDGRFYDTDRDGKEELVYSDGSHHTIKIYENTGDNAYDSVAVVGPLWGEIAEFVSGDFDQDGRGDIAFGDCWDYVYVVACTADNTYELVWRGEAALDATYDVLAVNDQDQDGRPEFVIGATTIQGPVFFSQFEASGDNQYELVWSLCDTNDYVSRAQMAVGDLDCDGLEEFVTQSSRNGLRVWEAVGNDRYVEVWQNPQSGRGQPWAFDLNNNGYDELIVPRFGDPRAYMGMGLAIYELESIQPPVIIYTWPDSLEPVLGPGDRMGVNATFFNHTDAPETLEAWSMLGRVVGENSQPTIGPLVGPVPVVIPAHDSVSGRVVHQIPPRPPIGTFAYYVYVGHYPDQVVDYKLFWVTLERGVENGSRDWPGTWEWRYRGQGSKVKGEKSKGKGGEQEITGRSADSGQRTADPTPKERIYRPGAGERLEESWLGRERSPDRQSAALSPDSALCTPQCEPKTSELPGVAVQSALQNPKYALSEDILVSSQPRGQYFPQIVPDGSGGAIFVWRDHQNDPYNPDLYAQRVDSLGTRRWATAGIPICTALSWQGAPVVVSDGHAGCIVAWEDYRIGNCDPYVQRLDSLGNPRWTSNGVNLCARPFGQDYPAIATDGLGGAIITWRDEGRDYPEANLYDIFAQRVSNAGGILWAANGLPVCLQLGSIQEHPTICSDGKNGAVVAWQDRRNGNRDIYAQRIGGNGSPYWTLNGIPIAVRPEKEELPLIVSDGASGGILAWRAWSGLDWDLYTQRVDSSGNLCWGSQGVLVGGEVEHQWHHAIVEDGQGGAIVAWQDLRNDIRTPDIYVQRVDRNGNLLWGDGGIPVSTASGTQGPPSITSDGNRGAFIVWRDGRAGEADIYAQHVTANGDFLWEYDGRLVSGAPEGQWWSVLCPDGSGGAWVGWHDYRNPGMVADIYAHHLSD